MGAYVFDLAVIQFDPIPGFTKNCLLIDIIGHLADTLENNWRIIVIFRRCLIVNTKCNLTEAKIGEKNFKVRYTSGKIILVRIGMPRLKLMEPSHH